MIDYKAQGKANRAKGARFELKTRKKLEKDGWVVDKFTNNVDLDKEEIITAKANPFNKFNRSGNGFPDFVGFMQAKKTGKGSYHYRVIFVECKTNNTLSKTEKLKMNYLIKQGHDCWVAYDENKKVRFRKLVEYKGRTRVRRENPKDNIR